MHILLIHQAFTNLDEAGGTRHIELARFLSNKGHRITIIASPVSYLSGKSKSSKFRFVERESIESRINIIRTYTYSALHRSFPHRVLSFLSFMFSSFFVALTVKEVDLVWGTSPPIFQAAACWLVARLKRVPYLLEIRDLWPAFAIAVGVLKNRNLIAASEWLEKFLYRHADRIIVNSPGYLNHVVSKGGQWVELIPNGADPYMFDPLADGKDFRRQYHLEEKFIILYAGAHGVSNDLEVILGAAKKLISIINICFLLVGDGKEKSYLQNEALELKLTNINFLPPVPKTLMPQVFAAADACVAILKPLDLYKTTYPNKVFDYMAAGRPVLLAIDGVIRKVVEIANAGVFIPPGNPEKLAEAIIDLIENPKMASTYGENGRIYIEKYFNRSLQAEKITLLLEDMQKMCW